MKTRSGLFSLCCLVSIISDVFIIFGMVYGIPMVIWFIIAIALLNIVTIAMLIWIWRRILSPVNKLQIATKKIMEGDFDFKLDRNDFLEIPLLYDDFERMRIKLKENEDEKLTSEKLERELVSNISHDLKTPLTAIRGYVEGILDGVASSPEKTAKYLKTIYNKTNDMIALIDELHYYSQVSGNELLCNFEKINVKDFFDKYIKDLSLEMETGKIIFKYNSNVSSAAVIEIDREQIKRVLNNIFSNSVKYNDKEKPEIQLNINSTFDKVIIQVSDNGIGINPEDLPHIFERFYRSDTSRNTKLGGSGIGLSIVKKIIEHHHGECSAKSVPGKGTDIIIELKKC